MFFAPGVELDFKYTVSSCYLMTSAKSVMVFLLAFSYKVIFVRQINHDDNDDDDGGISNKKLGNACIQQHFWTLVSVVFLRFLLRE